MNWPTHTDYQDAIQNPALCFAEPDLKAGTAACDMLGLPRVMSGNFASVYELNTGEQRWAVRCFVRQIMGQQGRYARLCQHLGAITLPWLVKFDYFLKGIMVRGEWYPIVKMEWVEGMPLNNYIEEHVNDPEHLRGLAGQWRSLVNDMRKHKLAHGDFQHGNIMVTPNHELRLVDYDGMYCPAFGKGRSPELGHANFQHPGRLPDHYDESLDNFPSLVIYTSLLALASEPDLWKEFYTGDNLLFLSGDYRNAQNSKIFARLAKSPDEKVQKLAALLQQCCLRPIAQVPWFEETIAALEAGTLDAQIAAMPAAPSDVSSAWLQDADAIIAEGSRSAGSRSVAQSEATPAGSRTATTAQAASNYTTGGTRVVPPTPARTGTQSATTTGTRTSSLQGTRPAPTQVANYDEPIKEDKGASKLFLAIAGIVVFGLVLYLIFGNQPAPTVGATGTVPAQEGR
ncbi:MAG: AarF/UbiB family protein [Verrucomicrobiota bacterium]|nr:AarF/UbiB family protein [Verrucomicrobiota bacterium]